MKLSEAKEVLTFDDVSLIPVHSTVRSRKEPDISTFVGKETYTIPIFSSPMNTVTEANMAITIRDLGGEGIVHRYMSVESQVQIVKLINSYEDSPLGCPGLPYFAVGATGDYLERTQSLYTEGVRKICVDVASGHSETLLEAARTIRKRFSDIVLMAGNVCSADGAWRLASEGVEVIRVGIGGGSICQTRLVTGFGVPNLSAIEDCVQIRSEFPNVSFLLDGGIRSSGDCVKSLVFADGVIVGNLLAGTEETPGEVLTNFENGQKYKKYNGMASREAREYNGWFTEIQASYVPEGVSIDVPFKGSVRSIIENLAGGIKVGLSYAGARNLSELRENAVWVRQTAHGYQEGLPRK